jgi:hypothetical protein
MNENPFRLRTLGDVLRDIFNKEHTYADDYDLYLPLEGEAWNENTKCALMPGADDVEIEDEPEFAIKHGLRRVMHIDILEGIAYNLRLQFSHPDVRKMLDAFLFYYDYDACIEMDGADASRLTGGAVDG